MSAYINAHALAHALAPVAMLIVEAFDKFDLDFEKRGDHFRVQTFNTLGESLVAAAGHYSGVGYNTHVGYTIVLTEMDSMADSLCIQVMQPIDAESSFVLMECRLPNPKWFCAQNALVFVEEFYNTIV